LKYTLGFTGTLDTVVNFHHHLDQVAVMLIYEVKEEPTSILERPLAILGALATDGACVRLHELPQRAGVEVAGDLSDIVWGLPEALTTPQASSTRVNN
jgi:hypothetical protein